jgi:hypothetical protein
MSRVGAVAALLERHSGFFHASGVPRRRAEKAQHIDLAGSSPRIYYSSSYFAA